MKTLLLACVEAAFAVLSLSVCAETAYWKDGGTGVFTDSSHWKNGAVPSAGWTVRFDGTTDAVVDDAAMDLFKSFEAVVLAGASTRLTIQNDTDTTIQKGKAWFVSDGIVRKTGTGTLTLDHTQSSTMISVYGGFEVRGGTLALVGGGNEVTPACPIGVFAPGVLQLPTDKEVRFQKLYGDGHVVNPPSSSSLRMFITKGTREAPGEFAGTFENYPVKYYGDNGSSQRFTNPAVDIGGNVYRAYLGTAKFPSCVFRDVSEYEYLGSGETTGTGKVFLNNGATCLTLNGGTNGALNVAAELYYNSDTASSTYVGEIVWTGDSAQTNVFSGKQSVNGARPVYWKKTGTGTWRFVTGGARGNAGVVATERGRLEYDDMAEAGSDSPLGRANNLLSEYHGAAVDEAKRVSYAYLLGDGTNDVGAATATMAYIGATAKKITTRPVALKGAGRFEATTAALDWKGFTSAATGTNVLVLAGAATGCVARDVTNGVGKVAVVKEGAGDWTLDGHYDLDAGIEVRGGRLTLNDAGYEWYRLSLMQNYAAYDKGNTGTPLGQRPSHDGGNVWLTGFGLFDAGKNNLIKNMTVNTAANGKPTLLEPGEAALGHDDFSQMGSGTTYQLANLFVNDNTPFGGHRAVGAPVLENAATWVSVVVRLRAGARVPTAYDLKSYGATSWTAGLVRDVRSWKLEGSADGVNWTELHRVVSNETQAVSANYRWYSSNTDAYSTGYGVEGAPFSRPSSIACIAAAQGATLKTTAPLTVSGLRYDVTRGGGTIDGFAFAPYGTVEVVNQLRGGSWNLPLTFAHCTGSLDGWAVSVNGTVKPGYAVKQTADGLAILPLGMLILVR